MSRTYAKVKISIWGDSDFRELSEPAQALYFKLLTSPTLRLCGVADWRPKRMAALTRGQTVAEIEDAAQELQDDLYVIFDEDTEEALLRTFIKHDGVLKTPNVAASMVKDFAAVASADLRGIIVHELHKLSGSEPEHKGWPVVREVLDNPSINPSVKASPKVSGKASGDPSVRHEPTPSSDASGIDAHIPQPPAINPQPPSGAGPAQQALVVVDIPTRAKTNDLVGEWVQTLPQRPPASFIARMGKQVKALLEEGTDQDVIREALPLWHKNGNAPESLPSFVFQVQRDQSRQVPAEEDNSWMGENTGW